ncbi:hypothetical protein D3C87_2021620 [compost metagenome]
MISESFRSRMHIVTKVFVVPHSKVIGAAEPQKFPSVGSLDGPAGKLTGMMDVHGRGYWISGFNAAPVPFPLA